MLSVAAEARSVRQETTILEALGNLGDFLGGVGVLVSLVYLAFQVRQNTIASKADSYQEAVSAANEWSREVGASAELCELLQSESESYSNLSTIDRLRFNLLMSSYFRNMENIHAKFESGAIENTVWIGWATRLDAMFRSPGIVEWWRQNEAGFNEEFRSNLRVDTPTSERTEAFGTRSE